jgi:FKBP-type peptidyl-prolyl cis-trans isomerase FkpA
MRRIIITGLIALLALPALAADEPVSEEQKTLYTVGQMLARQLSVFNLTPAEFEFVKQGLTDATTGEKPLVDLEAYRKKALDLGAARRDAQGKKLLVTAREFTAKAAAEKGAIKTPSGAVYQSIVEGTGPSPKADDNITVNYRVSLVDGRELESSYVRGQASVFAMNKGIKCWTEGMPLMKQGGRARLICPPETAYGDKPTGITPANATLVFDVQLLAVSVAEKKDKPAHAGM